MSAFRDCRRAHEEAWEMVAGMEAEVGRAGALLVDCLQKGGVVLLAGNGGSASDAQHWAGELVGRFQTDRRALPAIAFAGQEATLTAIANDYGYDRAFARQVAAFARPGSLFVGISTSGSSPNIVAAAEEAKRSGIKVLSLTGRDGGALRPLSDVCLNIPHHSTARVQEMHIFLIHVLCQMVDEAYA